jgi:CRP-like cAMP-binding protein
MIKGIFPVDSWNFKSETILEDLPEQDTLFENSSEDVYKRGQLIFKEGEAPEGIFFIKEGKVKKYKVDKEGKEQIIYIARAGELIGYHALLAEELYPDSAAAIESSKINFISKEHFLSVLNGSKILSQRLLKILSHEFSVFANNLTLIARRTVRERVATQLLLLREKYKHNFTPGMLVAVDVSREDLANLVGTARENVLRVLKDFKDEEILETKGRKIIIKDVKKLLQVCNY